MALHHSRSRKRTSRRRRALTAVGAFVTSAAVGSAAPAAAAPVIAPQRHGALDAMLRQTERKLPVWEQPQDVFEVLLRGRFDAAAAPADRAIAPARTPEPQGPPPVFRFDIPPGPLTVALRLFEQATGIGVRVAPELVQSLTSPGASGPLTADAALRQILSDSNLTFRMTGPGTVVVEVRPVSDAVRVTADAVPSMSSPKLPGPLLETPQTITVVPSEVIESQGATTLRDVLRNVPGITMQAGEGGGGLPGDSLTLRGFSATNDIFVDGVRDVGSYSRDAFNLEQVEVIKGPSSAFGGRGSTGGVINLATKTPALASIRQGTVGLGSAGYQRTTVDVNEPIGTGAAVRVNAMLQDAGVAGRDVVNNQSWAVAPAVGVGLDTRTRVAVSSQHVRQDNVPDYGLPWRSSVDPASGEEFPTGAFEATPPVDQRNFYGLAGYDFEDIRSDMATARLDHDVRPGLTLRNITRYGETFRDSAITAPRPPNRQLQRRQMRNDILANQTSLAASLMTGVLHHDVTAGLEFGREVTATENSAQSTNQPPTNLRAPNPLDRPLGPMPELEGNPLRSETRTVGAYLFDSVNVTDAVEVTGGLRWDRSEVDFAQTIRESGEVIELGRTDSMVSWRGGVVYKPRANGSIYLGYGTSFNPAPDNGNTGTALSAAENAANNVNLEPEKSRNVEVGTKWSAADDRLAITTAWFRTEKTNARTRALSSEPYVLAGRLRVQGVEVGASGRIRPSWTLFASYAFMDSEIMDTANPLEAGHDLALTPAHTASLWLTGQIAPRFQVGGGAQFMDAVFRNTTTDLRVPSYWLVNATASYELNSHLTLRVNGLNLTDTQYVDRVGGGHYIPGSRRSVQVTTSVGF